MRYINSHFTLHYIYISWQNRDTFQIEWNHGFWCLNCVRHITHGNMPQAETHFFRLSLQTFRFPEFFWFSRWVAILFKTAESARVLASKTECKSDQNYAMPTWQSSIFKIIKLIYNNLFRCYIIQGNCYLYPAQFAFNIFGNFWTFSRRQLCVDFANQFFGSNQFQFECSRQFRCFL